jgi:low-affinity ferrous iron transport protein
MATRWQRFVASISPEKTPIYAAAPTQKIRKEPAGGAPSFVDEKGAKYTQSDEESSPSDVSSKPRANTLDKITKAAGSSPVFFIMLALLAAWSVVGVINGPSDTWQIIMQNASSVQVYVTDILLLRQSANARRAMMTTLAEIQSRNKSCERLIRQIPDCQFMETHKEASKQLLINGRSVEEEVEESLFMVSGRPSRFQYVWTKSCHVVSVSLGSIWAVIFYWIGVGVWVGIGPPFQFSNLWQLYINTAVAIALTFTSVFLQNIEQQQEDSLEKCLDYALKIDAEIGYHLRDLLEDTKPNPIFEIPPPKINKVQSSIERFALIMGSGLGVLISLVFLVVWIAFGPLLEFDDNWVLILGTFTGLIGFIDGFVLRNLYSRAEYDIGIQFQAIAHSDERILDVLNVPTPRKPIVNRSLSARIRVSVGDICASQWTSVASVLFVVLLLAIASVLKWSETGQLLCNTPTMIIEGFLLLVLIQAHNVSNESRGQDFNGVLKRRLLLNSYVHTLSYD